MQLPTFLRPIGSFAISDRRILFLMAIVGFVTGYGGSQLAHTLPFARADLGLSEGQMSLVFAGVRAVSLSGLAFAVLADRGGRRRPLLVAYLLLVTGNLATAFLPTVMAYAVAQSITRVAVVAVAAVGVVLVAEELSPPVRGYGLGIYGLAGSMGVGVGLVLLPIAERSDGAWRILFALTGLGLLAAPLLNRYLPESRAFGKGKRVGFWEALSMGLGRHFWPLAGVAFLVAAYSAPAFDFVLERLIDDLAWRASAARFLLIVSSGLGAVGLLLGGRLADVAGRRVTVSLAVVLGVAGGGAFYLVTSGWLLAPAVFVATLGATMLAPAFGAQRSELFPTAVRARAGAWVTNAAIVGSISGFLLGGALIDRIGLSTTIAGLGGLALLSVVFELRLPETRGLDLVRRRRRRPTIPSSPPAPRSTPGSPTTPPADPTPTG